MRLMEAVQSGHFVVLLTDTVIDELVDAPEPVRRVLEEIQEDTVEHLELTPEVLTLRDVYLEAGIVGRRYRGDAAHVAAATVARADAIVSWNFRHIVQLEKIKAYNRINLLQGYGIMTIVTPKEALPHDYTTEEDI